MDHTIPHNEIKLIVLDLDGTLLNSKKELSPGNYAALEQAAAKGIYVVPCTGRFFKAMPECIRSLPFLRYAIPINGAEIYDVQADRSLRSALITPEQADEIFAALDGLPVIYDCFQDGWGWMDRKFYEVCDQFEASDTAPGYIQQTRTPVENFRQVINARDRGIQKIQMFFLDQELRSKVLEELPQQFPDLNVTASLSNNIEVNSREAHKGNALLELCRYLQIDPSQTMAFGDGLNDLTMLKTAGIGVAMGNAAQQLKDVADFVTDTNDNDGVAKAIGRFCFGSQ
jgi:Cof subfamily protein (haloacid dehalogenase superfamily)